MAALGALRISTVGLRGVVGAGLTAAHAVDFAAAFGTFLDSKKPVVIGRDPRASGVMIREGVISALLACGHDAIDLGVVSTPVLQHAIRRLDAAGGISIGASHNAAEWNALKFLGRQGAYLSTPEANELLDFYHLRKFDFVEWRGIGRLIHDDTALDAYLAELERAFDFGRLRRFRVLVDCCNGTSALILRRLNDRFGFGFILINERSEGVAFAHEPATSESAVALQLAPLVRPVNADAGFVFDLDSDRVAMATEFGAPVSEEMMLPMLADSLLPRGPGKLAVTNLSTTALLEEIAAKHGGEVVRAPVGRQAAMDALAGYGPDQVAIAGEGTGAVMMPRFRFIYDGIASMLGVLTMMADRGQTLSEIVQGYPKYSILKGQVPLQAHRIPAMLAQLQRKYSDGRAGVIDGLRVDWPGRWFHVRVSQTEAIVRIICEQRGGPPRELFEALMEQVRSFA